GASARSGGSDPGAGQDRKQSVGRGGNAGGISHLPGRRELEARLPAVASGRGGSSQEFARVFQAGHQIEQCLKDGKSEAGLGDYQVRTWEGWHHHQVLSLVATWFLKQEARRGKNPDAGVDASATAAADSGGARSAAQGLSGE